MPVNVTNSVYQDVIIALQITRCADIGGEGCVYFCAYHMFVVCIERQPTSFPAMDCTEIATAPLLGDVGLDQ